MNAVEFGVGDGSSHYAQHFHHLTGSGDAVFVLESIDTFEIILRYLGDFRFLSGQLITPRAFLFRITITRI